MSPPSNHHHHHPRTYSSLTLPYTTTCHHRCKMSCDEITKKISKKKSRAKSRASFPHLLSVFLPTTGLRKKTRRSNQPKRNHAPRTTRAHILCVKYNARKHCTAELLIGYPHATDDTHKFSNNCLLYFRTECLTFNIQSKRYSLFMQNYPTKLQT